MMYYMYIICRWLEGKQHWAEGGPDDCMTCPVGEQQLAQR